MNVNNYNNNSNSNYVVSNGDIDVALPSSIYLLLSSLKKSEIVSTIVSLVQQSSSTTLSTSTDSNTSTSTSTCTRTFTSDSQKRGSNTAGYVNAITSQCITRFKTPTLQQIEAYSTDIRMIVRNNDVKQAKLLWKRGKFVNCNAFNRFGESILHIACRHGYYEMMQFFIKELEIKIYEIRDDYHRTTLALIYFNNYYYYR